MSGEYEMRAGKQKKIQQAIRALMMENKLNQAITNELVQDIYKEPELAKFFLYVEILNTNPIIDYVFNTDQQITIGRDLDWSMICIQDVNISRKHAILYVQEGFVFLQNVSAGNQVKIKRGFSRKILLPGERGEVLHGDTVRIGESKIRICLFQGDEIIVN